MEYAQYIEHVRSDGAALTSAARAAGIDAPVPSCPEWTVVDLVQHVGRIHRWVADIVANQPEDTMRAWSEPFPPDAELIDWFAAGVALVADALAAAPPDAPAYSWTDDHTAGFWARRMANELAVHRYDGQLAAGAPEPVERALAVDGIDEFFDLIPFWSGRDNAKGDGASLHFHCTDGEGEWLAVLAPDGLRVTREHAKGDVAARGTASDLMLFLYGRVPAEDLDVFGDAALLARWRELIRW